MSKLKKILKWNAFPSFALLVISLIVNAVLTGGLTGSFVKSYFLTNTPAIILAIGVGATIIIGGTDISLGAIVSLVNVSIVSLSGLGYSLPMVILFGLLISLVCGMINGLVIGKLRVNALLATFATSTIFGGIALWILPFPGGSLPVEFSRLYSYFIFGIIPVPLIILLVILLFWYGLMQTPFGIKVYAIGDNVEKSYASGIDVAKSKFLIHTFAGLLAGIAGLCLSANISAGSPRIGDTMSMNSIAAAVIGGISLSGGYGNMIGAVFGASFLSLITSIVVSANVGSFVQSFVQGLIMLLGVLLSVMGSNRNSSFFKSKKRMKTNEKGVINGN
ncbi:MAG: ABC transporter permease [Saccharofermentanales bacterium]